MARPYVWSLLTLCMLIGICKPQVAEKQTGLNPCTAKTRCNECIQTPSCVWCSQPNFFDHPRCFQTSMGSPLGHCGEAYVYEPDIIYNDQPRKSLTKASGFSESSYNASSSAGMSSLFEGQSQSSSKSTVKEIVQISPQRVTLNLRINEAYRFDVSFAQAEDYPVDLYYLMDLSKSMQDDKENLSKLGELLSNSMKKLTSNFRLGFGSFVDKVVMPYVSTVKKRLKSPCDVCDKDNVCKPCEAPYGYRNHMPLNIDTNLFTVPNFVEANAAIGFDISGAAFLPNIPSLNYPRFLNLLQPCPNCAAPYGYRNGMSLSTNTTKFSDEVRRAAVSGNLDAPEGGFDAIMQAIVCNEIGWRHKARRLLVFSTDAGFHYAGDGKLGGIVKPNDGECHLHDSTYTYSKIQDYPSISQVNVKVKENAINIIFAVTQEQISVYEQLKDLIEGSTAGMLSNDSSNVVNLIKEQYGKITSSVQLSDNSTSPISIKYYSSCLGGGPQKQTSKCDGLKVGQMVNFTAEFLITSCPKDPKNWKQTIKIYPVGINESLIVDLQMLCDCPCERPGNSGYQIKSPNCNNHGTFNCGVCNCDSQYFGENCECSIDLLTSTYNDTRGCRPDNKTSVDCTGRGTCICGQCKCHAKKKDQKITGKYCECDDHSCDRHNTLLCSGPDHGKCECGTCTCNPGWTGKACDCKSTNETCIPPGGGEVCSNHGQCVCGQCVCDVSRNDTRYSGRYCDKCAGCTGRCLEFKECVQCQQFKSGPLMKDDLCSQNCTFVPIEVEKVKADNEKDENLCWYDDVDLCRFYYVYSYGENDKVIIKVQKTKECPPRVFMLGIVLGVIAAIVLIGLAILLLWKMVTTIHDRREFARFEKERMMAKWDTGENPIYKQATSTFKNPTYAGR